MESEIFCFNKLFVGLYTQLFGIDYIANNGYIAIFEPCLQPQKELLSYIL